MSLGLSACCPQGLLVTDHFHIRFIDVCRWGETYLDIEFADFYANFSKKLHNRKQEGFFQKIQSGERIPMNVSTNHISLAPDEHEVRK